MPLPPSSVSFTVRRPTPVSRPSSSGPESDGSFKIPALPRRLASAGSSAPGSPLAGSPRAFSSRDDSDNETGIVFSSRFDADNAGRDSDSSDEDNLVAGPKSSSRRRVHQKKTEAPLVIPARPNPDWREAAKKRRAGCARAQPHPSRATLSFVPDSVTTGADGSVGGLGTRDTINSGPQLSGLQVKKRFKLDVEGDGAATMEVESAVSVCQSTVNVVDETEDQRALRAVLAGDEEAISIGDIIPTPPLSEADALKQDIQELPDVSTADDYERIPISAFGAAMLRGMGWTDGVVAPKSGKRANHALKELYLPQTRPALLGIGAKERETEDDGSEKKKSSVHSMPYIPIAKKQSDSAESESSRSVSRRDRRDRRRDR